MLVVLGGWVVVLVGAALKLGNCERTGLAGRFWDACAAPLGKLADGC